MIDEIANVNSQKCENDTNFAEFAVVSEFSGDVA